MKYLQLIQKLHNEDFMVCEFCKQGAVLKAIINKTHDLIEICDECDSVWYDEGGIVKITNFSDLMRSKQLQPLWSEITIIDE